MKLCKDCGHFVTSGAKCDAAADPVFGLSRIAADLRYDPNECGLDAKWFTPAKEEDWREPRDEHGYRKPE